MSENIVLKYRPNVCLFILNKDYEIFIGERINDPSCWQLPQGGTEEEFSLIENALREAEEETGAEAKFFKHLATLKATHQYDFLNIPNFAKNLWRGQSQNFVVLQFTGNNDDFNLNKYSVPEFRSWRWCNIEDFPYSIQPIRLTGYAKALPEVKYLIQNLKNKQ